MSHGRFEIRQLLIVGVAALLLAGFATASFGSGEEAPPAPPGPGKSDVGPGGCCGGCARSERAGEGPRCRRASESNCCGAMGRRSMRGSGHGRAANGGQHGGGPAVMQTVRALVHDYREVIERQVEEVENGVVTVTRAPSSAEAAAAIGRHVREMKQVLENGGRVRMWDPLFRELFDHADEISMRVEELDDGMRVTETSDNPEVVELIQAHARKVSEFVERGPAAVHEETPLPAGYGVTGESEAAP